MMTREQLIHMAVVRVQSCQRALTRAKRAARRLRRQDEQGGNVLAWDLEEAEDQVRGAKLALDEALARREELGPTRHQRYYRKNRNARKAQSAAWRTPENPKYLDELARRRAKYRKSQDLANRLLVARLGFPGGGRAKKE